MADVTVARAQREEMLTLPTASGEEVALARSFPALPRFAHDSLGRARPGDRRLPRHWNAEDRRRTLDRQANARA